MWIATMVAALASPNEPVDAVRALVQAADAQAVGDLEKVLHADFRVVAQMPSGVSVMTREAYVGLVEAKKIGGKPRKQDLQEVSQSGDIATVRGTLDSEAAHFDSVWTVVRTDKGWQVVQDATVFSPKGG